MRGFTPDPSVVVDELDVISVAILPDETQSPLIIDPDSMLTGSSAGERFK